MNRGNLIRLGIIVVLLALALSEVLVRSAPSVQDIEPGNNTMGMRLGLDLSGGIHLVYEADLSQIGDEDPGEAMRGAIEIISKRVDAYGVTEPVIQKQGNDRISVQLPGIRDMEAAVDLIGTTARLDFREILLDSQGSPAEGEVAFILGNVTLSPADKNKLADDLTSGLEGFKEIDSFGGTVQQTALVFSTAVSSEALEEQLDSLGYGNATFELVEKLSYWDPERFPTSKDESLWVPALGAGSNGEQIHLTGTYLKRNSQVGIRQDTNEPEVQFEFDSEGADLFAQITGRLIEKPLGIVLDDRLVSWPIVKSKIEGGKGVIENIELDDARNLSILLNAGALKVPLGHWERGTFFSGPAVQDEVDPTLGADSISKSLVAGAVGLILVLLFMALYYRLPGLLAGGALLIYAVLVLAAFKLIPVTLTLAGIAAFILSIGMAVDANVLIFERLKEELRTGRTLGGAVETGFNRAWTAIRDSNVTTLIICGILYWMGSNFAEPRVMGFALTLAIGVALSMFTAIFVTRTFLRLLVGTRFASNLWLFGAQKGEQVPTSEEYE